MATITNTCLPHYTITNTWHISYSLRLTLSPRSIWWSVETIERLSSEHSSLSHSPSLHRAGTPIYVKKQTRAGIMKHRTAANSAWVLRIVEIVWNSTIQHLAYAKFAAVRCFIIGRASPYVHLRQPKTLYLNPTLTLALQSNHKPNSKPYPDHNHFA